MTHTTDNCVKPESSTVLYQTLLAFHQGQLDARSYAAVLQRLAANRRWRAHLDSLRSLDLEEAAAQHDALNLGRFETANATAFCREVAATGGEVLSRFLRRQQDEALGAARPAWDQHVNGCVYCRRMRRLMQAQIVRERNDIPEGERLLRERLLEDLYRAALDRVTQALAPHLPPAPPAAPAEEETTLLGENTILELKYPERTTQTESTTNILEEETFDVLDEVTNEVDERGV